MFESHLVHCFVSFRPKEKPARSEAAEQPLKRPRTRSPVTCMPVTVAASSAYGGFSVSDSEPSRFEDVSLIHHDLREIDRIDREQLEMETVGEKNWKMIDG